MLRAGCRSLQPPTHNGQVSGVSVTVVLLHRRTAGKQGRERMSTQDAKARQSAPLKTPTDLTQDAVRDISGALNALLADMFALYLKTKNFHWHVSGPHFRDYHLLLD